MTRKVICDDCNNRFGSHIDKALAQSVSSLRNICNFKSGNGSASPKLKNVIAGGIEFDLEPGGIPKPKIPRSLETNRVEDGTVDISINTRNETEYKKRIKDAIRELRISNDKAVEFRKSMLNSATLKSSPIPRFYFQLSLGSEEAQRSMMKACLVLWAENIGTNELLSPRYSDAKSFVLNDTEADRSLKEISLDTRSLPESCAEYGTNPNLVWVGSNGNGRALGYYRLYGATGWTFEIAKEDAPPDQAYCLVSNPYDVTQWRCGEDVAAMIDFNWVADRQDRIDEKALVSMLEALDRNAHNGAIKHFIGQVVEENFKRLGLKDGDVLAPKVLDKLAKLTSYEMAHTLLRLPYELPINMTEWLRQD